MDDWLSVITAGSELPANAVQQLHDIGFIVIPGAIAPAKLSQLPEAYDAAVLAAHPDDVRGRKADGWPMAGFIFMVDSQPPAWDARV